MGFVVMGGREGDLSKNICKHRLVLFIVLSSFSITYGIRTFVNGTNSTTGTDTLFENRLFHFVSVTVLILL